MDKTDGRPVSLRGRIMAVTPNVDGAGVTLRIRCNGGDIDWWAHSDDSLRPGDWVQANAAGALMVVYHGTGDYPEPGCESARLSRRRWDFLRARARMMATVRAFFAQRDFVEVDTPVRVRAPGLDVQIRAMATAGDRWLITSPEMQMKRLLVAGMERIYTVCKCFREGESGPLHNSEFTMLEWYRSFAGLDAIIADTEELVAQAAEATSGSPHLVLASGKTVDVTPPWPRATVAEVMERYARVPLRGDEEAGVLAERLAAAGIAAGTAKSWDDLFYTAFVERVEPALAAMNQPLFLTDWPVHLSALAQRKRTNPALVERFEAYVGGIELGNAFGELTCAAEQRSRFAADLRARQERGLPVYPVDERFLAALEEGMPPSAGIALGVDRLAMLLLGAAHIREVCAFVEDEL